MANRFVFNHTRTASTSDHRAAAVRVSSTCSRQGASKWIARSAGLLAWALLASTAADAAPAMVKVLPDGKRTLLTTQTLKAGDELQAEFLGPQNRVRCCMALKIKGSLPAPDNVTDQLEGKPVLAYELPPLDRSKGMPFLGAAWVGPGDRPPRERMPVVCTSREGAHLLLLDRGRPAAHLYMNFGYAVLPSCDHRLLARFD